MTIDGYAQRMRVLIASAIPHTLLMMSQSVMAGIDSLIVAPLGTLAIAAVGLSSFVFAVLTSGLIGLMISAQAAVGRAVGANRSTDAVIALQTALLIGIGIGGFLIITIPFLPLLTPYLTDNDELAAYCEEYLTILLISAPAVGVIRAFRGFLGGIQRNNLSLVIILLIYATNVPISIVLVASGYGLKGAAIGTTASFYIGTLACLTCQRFIGKEYRIWSVHGLRGHAAPIMLQTFFSGVQQCLFSAVFAVVFVIAGYISAEALAIITILNNILVFMITPLIGLGLASTTFVSVFLGQGCPASVKTWVNMALLMGIAIYIIQLPAVFLSEKALFIFLKSDQLAQKYAPLLSITIIVVFCEIFGQILKFSLFGARESRRVVFVTSLLQWGLFIPSAYVFCVILNQSVAVLWFTFLTYRVLESASIAWMWIRYINTFIRCKQTTFQNV